MTTEQLQTLIDDTHDAVAALNTLLSDAKKQGVYFSLAYSTQAVGQTSERTQVATITAIQTQDIQQLVKHQRTELIQP